MIICFHKFPLFTGNQDLVAAVTARKAGGFSFEKYTTPRNSGHSTIHGSLQTSGEGNTNKCDVCSDCELNNQDHCTLEIVIYKIIQAVYEYTFFVIE